MENQSPVRIALFVGAIFLALVAGAFLVARQMGVFDNLNFQYEYHYGDERVTTTTFYEARDVGQGSCSLNVEWPTEIEADTPEAAAKIQAETDDWMASLLELKPPHIDETMTRETAVKYWITMCQKELEDIQAAEDPQGYYNLDYTLTINSEVKSDNDNVLSLIVVEDRFTGGAHPNIYTAPFNFDLHTGERYTIDRLVSSDKLANFMVAEKQKLLTQHADVVYPDTFIEYTAYVLNPTPEKTSAYTQAMLFWLTPDGSLKSYYNPYVIAPYAAGPLEVTFSADELSSYRTE